MLTTCAQFSGTLESRHDTRRTSLSPPTIDCFESKLQKINRQRITNDPRSSRSCDRNACCCCSGLMLLISKLDLPLAPNWIPNPSSVDTSPTFYAGPAPAVPHSPPPFASGFLACNRKPCGRVGTSMPSICLPLGCSHDPRPYRGMTCLGRMR